jgi:hypothetical protein
MRDIMDRGSVGMVCSFAFLFYLFALERMVPAQDGVLGRAHSLVTMVSWCCSSQACRLFSLWVV